ncbi:transglycosylase SLT domain-containing protein [Streptomyces spinoverrucosus]|uniref:transglycosylase SLT domain-containing protein n=1 Tax=Streptomyces spinoverrucosus TaxID=284043 RepID=UPI0018C42B5F|nr:transglycosylase SLT domain-containing protein [Streptomyces spinoverrucosus]MBG0856386.1 transglycosylase SLT domain-containing protein [Streptomyces spinoverrucosus]
MLNNILRDRSPALTKNRKVALVGVATLGAAAVAISAVPSHGQTTTAEAAAPAKVAYSAEPVKDVKASVTDQLAGASVKVEAIAAKKKAAAEAAAKQKAAAEAAAAKKSEQRREAKAAASRSVERIAFQPLAAKKALPTKAYGNNLDGWIREALSIMKAKGIPGSYHGLHKNIMRESSGNPNAINNWDINAQNGIPSKGLLQVIPPTFKAYHVPGTSWNIYDPVANITAAANYAADRYGSIDNVNSAY